MSGKIVRVRGPVVMATGLPDARVFDMMHVGPCGLIGEVVRLDGMCATIQVYEDTTGLQAGDPVENTGSPYLIELGPGLLASIFDGLQRPLDQMSLQNHWIERGQKIPALDREKRWRFVPAKCPGNPVEPGDCIGSVLETQSIEHRILIPARLSGEILEIAEGDFALEDVVAKVKRADGIVEPIHLLQKWPARIPRPVSEKQKPNTPLITGQRILDTFFPTALGGTTIIPGGFGTGKTVLEQTLVRWAQADIIIFIGCGERGNEMAEVLEEFPHLRDPKTNSPLIERSILVANTSNMPVCAREGSIYLGITMAEYYRDMGYRVLLLADSTSRWGEALREVSGRLEEMPGEEGYPAYLSSRLAQFYERAGVAQCLGTDKRTGSVTIVGAVSPPGGDFSEPVTQSSMRTAGTLWGLDADLARRRHFPAVQWQNSYTLYQYERWFAEHVHPEWPSQVTEAMSLLQKESELQALIQLVGPEAIPEAEKATLLTGRMLREDFLQQSAFHLQDAYCSLEKQFWMLKIILMAHRWMEDSIQQGKRMEELSQDPVLGDIATMKTWNAETFQQKAAQFLNRFSQSN